MSNDRRSRLGALAATRFGLGARGDEIARASADPIGWLLAQLEGPGPTPAPRPATPERLAAAHAVERLPGSGDAAFALHRGMADADLLDRARHGAETLQPFRERWALFWANHFALRVGGPVELLAGAYVREAVDPHLTGRFADLAEAALTHPAMLAALDQPESTGPNSPAGRASGRGLNENLGREILELHTVGRAAAYDQADVVEMARLLTGWSYAGGDADEDARGRFRVDLDRREPGGRIVLGRRYAEGEALACVRHLAGRPEAHERVALKVARHFVADAPAPALVRRLAAALDRSGGSLPALAEALATAPEAWAGPGKFKRPYEFLVSAHRALGFSPSDTGTVAGFLRACGHAPLWADTAAGSSDADAVWATPAGLAHRAHLAQRLGGQAGAGDSLAAAAAALGDRLSERTRRLLGRGDLEPAEATALLLLSPEFLRR